MSCNSSTKKIVGFCIILAICISLSGLWPSVQCSIAGQQIDIQHESESTDLPKQTDSAIHADQIKLKKISCLYIIREDYNGLKLSYPSKLFFDSVKKEIYITDSGHSRILVYTYDFYPLLSVGKSNCIETPAGIVVDPEGYLFVAQSSSLRQKGARISVFNPSLRWNKDIFFEGFENADSFHPINIAINKAGKFYVAGVSFHGVVVLNEDGTFCNLLSPVDSLGKGEEQKATICDVEIGSSGRIYLLSEDMGRIYVYDDKENFLFKFGKKGGGSGKLSRPRGMALDKHNKIIYVIDYMRHTANAYSENGHFLFEFGGKGWGKGWFQYPSDITADDSGNVLIADTFNNRVQALKIEVIPSVAVAEKVKPKDIITKELVKETKPEAPAGKELVEPKPVKHYIVTANMNLLEKSVTSSRLILLMKKGEEFEILSQDKHDELTSWYFIKTGSGRTGWLCGIYRGKIMFMEKQRKQIAVVAKIEEVEPDVSVTEKLAEKVKPKDIITKELVKETKPEAPAGKELVEPKPVKHYIVTANMNLLEKSVTSSRLILLMKKGEEFEILSQDKHDELTSWYFIKTGSGRTGWLCGIYRGKIMFMEKQRKQTKHYILTANLQDVTTLKLKVLSGDGDLNSAKKMAKKLRNMGYKIKLIDRAPQSSFLRNTVFFALGFQDEAKRLGFSLGDNTILKPLSWSSIFDIIVVTGKNGQSNFMEK